MNRLRLVGYWRSDAEPGLPDPLDFVETIRDPTRVHVLDLYLATGTVVRAFMGMSRCRICGQLNGSLEFTDGTYVWPEGLAHYVSEHDVRPPAEFEAHVVERLDQLAHAAGNLDIDWWITATGLRPTESDR